MHNQAHEVVARCACATAEQVSKLEIPTEKIVRRIMEPDRENWDRHVHRAEREGWSNFTKSIRRARRLLTGNREFVDVVGPVAEALHLATDFCTVMHAPGIIKEGPKESAYERQIEKMAEKRRIEPSTKALDWYESSIDPINVDAFVREAHGEHWHQPTPDSVDSTPIADLEQAIYVASAILLAITGEKRLSWEDSRSPEERWTERAVMGGLCLIPVVGPALVASYYLTPPEDR